MQPGVRSHNLSSSDLNRLIAELCLADTAETPGRADLVEAADPAQSFGERLGQWLNWTDAIALSAALAGKPDQPSAAHAGPAQADAARALDRTRSALDRTRSALALAIASEGARLARDSQASATAATDFTPLRRHYTAQQRAMETTLQPLRAQLRAQLAASSAGGARLAALDAVLDNALAPRERAVLAQVPTLLEERHARLRKAKPEPEADNQGDADTPQPWLPALHADLQKILLAELDLRLQPLLGLQEALQQEKQPTP